jgi:TRAP-type C4-dicarboxylate transport system permease small subunit
MNRTTAIILTVATALLCGCVALIACVFGALIAVGAPITTDLMGTTTSQAWPTGWGYAFLCLGFVFLAVPIIVGIVTLRKKKTVDMPTSMPPAA